MTIFRSRGEFVFPTEVVHLLATFKDFNGNLTDLSSFPTVSIIEPSGNVVFGPTTIGVYHLSLGVYGYDFSVPYSGPYGVHTDAWVGMLDGYFLYKELNFVVQNTQLPSINSDGYIHLGDDVQFNYSQNALLNVNKLIKAVRARLNSRGRSKTKDEFGNVIYEDCDIFSIDQLATFVGIALTAFNQIPHFTSFTFEDTDIISNFFEVIVQHAVIYALSSKALIERGREYSLTDNGVSFTPPGVSEILQTQYSAELNNWFEKVKLIKANMKPAGLGLGSLRPLAAAPAFLRLRHLRQRQII